VNRQVAEQDDRLLLREDAVVAPDVADGAALIFGEDVQPGLEGEGVWWGAAECQRPGQVSAGRGNVTKCRPVL
jgi:hypothetical protein